MPKLLLPNLIVSYAINWVPPIGHAVHLVPYTMRNDLNILKWKG